jgi:hypothetical protein
VNKPYLAKLPNASEGMVSILLSTTDATNAPITPIETRAITIIKRFFIFSFVTRYFMRNIIKTINATTATMENNIINNYTMIVIE